ncbi:hypothetical protein V2J83_25660 [Pseudomonas alliivorans]|nr:hypothetical protein [Pseudomonas alliivorans]
MYKKLPKSALLRELSAYKILSELTNSKNLQSSTRVGSFLSDAEVQSLREEMIRDGTYMKEWLRTKPKKII